MTLIWIKKTSTMFLFLCLLSIGVNIFWFHEKSDFTIKHFKTPIQIVTENPLIEFSEGTYVYLNREDQFITFQSINRDIILKLYYWKQPLDKNWYKYVRGWIHFASPAWIYQLFGHKKKVTRLFELYNWISSELSQETGIIGLHLCRTETPFFTTLIDKEGKLKRIDLSEVPFVLQKKAIPLSDYLNRKLHLQDIEGAKQAVRRLKELLFRRIEKGYIDTHPIYKKDYGFIEEQPVQICIEKIQKKADIDLEKEKKKTEESLKEYLEKYYPSIAQL